MNYEVINLKEKIVVGISTRTSNNDPNMTKIIGETWEKFFITGVYQSILNKKNDNTIGLYTNYENGIDGMYDAMVCCEVSNTDNLPAGLDLRKIPEGKYAKFNVKGNAQKVIADFWTKLWAINLDRKFSFDFEEYKSGCEIGDAEINIYISLN